MLEDYSHVNTKRKVVSLFSSLYDPIGLISLVTILDKLFIQKLWMMENASKEAYGVAYYVVTIEGKCQLLTAKARVTPKSMLELDEMWSDASTALQWVHSRQSTSPYVLNRVEEINRIRLNCRLLLKHVPMFCNPGVVGSSCQSRPQVQLMASWTSLANRRLRLPGPKQELCSLAAPDERVGRAQIPPFTPQVPTNTTYCHHLLTSDERAFFGQQNPYIDNNGVLRGHSRLSNAPPESGYMDPILLESHCALWRLIVEHWHEVLLHCNTSTLLVHLRKEFWVPRMRQQLKKILKPCIHCKRVQGQPYPTPPLAPVHPNRFNVEVPFRVTGLDYTGSFKVHRSHVDMVYLLLFTCAATRAVALETTTSLTVVKLVQAIRRFAARFGMPQCLCPTISQPFKLVRHS
ncbi:uncharacterized protein [Palaemon carinicauda]|uniref:uncharacterized protein n=1 Tax=Palaemon carinicauda TaxID=392227 RepID=UPI0035B5988E